MSRRTDLAVEEHEFWQQSTGYTTKLPGVRARENTAKGITTTWVDILDDRGAKAMHKPVGSYITIEPQKDVLRSPAGFVRAGERLGRMLSRLLPKGQILVVGLGNDAVTPDAVGPRALDHLLVTRHMKKYLPDFRSVSAIAPGVLGTTGMESAEVVRSVVEKTKPDGVVVVDALASGNPDRLCRTIQITDAGITPGSGVGNSRAAFNAQTLGVPVCAVGVPTVVALATFVHDLLQSRDLSVDGSAELCDPSMVLIPKDIDAGVERMARLVGFGISMALHKGISAEEIFCLMG